MRSSATLALALLALSSLPACQGHAGHQAPAQPTPIDARQRIRVVGVGKVEATPNVAELRLGVEAKADTVDAAMAEATRRAQQLKQTLKQLGIEDRDLKTARFSVSRIRERSAEAPRPVASAAAPAGPRSEASEPANRSGTRRRQSASGAARSKAAREAGPARGSQPTWRDRYQVTNTMQVTVRKLDTLGALLEAAVAAGANRSWGIQFRVKDPKSHQRAARKEAVVDAEQQARELAMQAGVRLGSVLAVRQLGSSTGGPRPVAFQAREESAGPPVHAGTTEFEERVEMVFAID